MPPGISIDALGMQSIDFTLGLQLGALREAPHLRSDVCVFAVWGSYFVVRFLRGRRIEHRNLHSIRDGYFREPRVDIPQTIY